MADKKETAGNDLDILQEMHAKLRKCKYWYYELHNSLISDYEFDMLEKKYDRLCDDLGIHLKLRVSESVGFSFRIPMDLRNYIYNNDLK